MNGVLCMSKKVVRGTERAVAGIKRLVQGAWQDGMKKEAGIDGILVTVGLCIIALLLCVVMKDSLTAFIQTLVTELTNEAKEVLSGVTP